MLSLKHVFIKYYLVNRFLHEEWIINNVFSEKGNVKQLLACNSRYTEILMNEIE